MLTENERLSSIVFLESLKTTTAVSSEKPNSDANLQSTLSACKGLEFLGGEVTGRDELLKVVLSTYDATSGGFVGADSSPAVFPSAVALLLQKQIGAKTELNSYAPKTLEFMSKNSSIREEHFMTIGVVDELLTLEQ